MNEQQQAWSGALGNAYTARNRVDWRARIPFWRRIMELTGARSVYEFGCNAGWNLSAIKSAAPYVECWGHDLNALAVAQAHAAGLRHVHCGSGASHWSYAQDAYPLPPVRKWPDQTYDLVFTAGVLIHVAPADLMLFMDEVIRVSAQYVLAVEYEAPEEQEIEYRGRMGLLWKRPYGELYQAKGLALIHSGEAAGFDRCTYWLMQKSS